MRHSPIGLDAPAPVKSTNWSQNGDRKYDRIYPMYLATVGGPLIVRGILFIIVASPTFVRKQPTM